MSMERIKWQTLVNTVGKLRVLQKAGNFITSWATGRLLRRNLLHVVYYFAFKYLLQTNKIISFTLMPQKESHWLPVSKFPSNSSNSPPVTFLYSFQSYSNSVHRNVGNNSATAVASDKHFGLAVLDRRDWMQTQQLPMESLERHHLHQSKDCSLFLLL